MQPGRVRGAVSLTLTALVAAVLAGGLLLPRTEGGSAPLLYLGVAFHALLLSMVALFALMVAVVVAVLRWRWSVIIAAVVVLGLSIAAAVPAVIRSPLEDSGRVVSSGNGALRVLEWNTSQQDVDETTIETLIAQTDPSIVVLPEYFTRIAQGAFAEIATQRDMQILGWEGSSATLLVSRRLGEYRVDHDGVPPWAGFVAVPSNPKSPRLVVTHLQRPGIASTALWREHVAWAASQCHGNVVAIGDFNATTANISPDGTLGACSDSATSLGQNPAGTWPTALPAALGATIDHVFTGSTWKPAAFTVLGGLDQTGSDHRPIFAVLIPTG